MGKDLVDKKDSDDEGTKNSKKTLAQVSPETAETVARSLQSMHLSTKDVLPSQSSRSARTNMRLHELYMEQQELFDSENRTELDTSENQRVHVVRESGCGNAEHQQVEVELRTRTKLPAMSMPSYLEHSPMGEQEKESVLQNPVFERARSELSNPVWKKAGRS